MIQQKVVTISHGPTDYLELEVGDLPLAVEGILARGMRMDGDAYVIGNYLDAVVIQELPAGPLADQSTKAALRYMAEVVDAEQGEGPRVLAMAAKSWALADIRNAIFALDIVNPGLSAESIADRLGSVLDR